MDFVDVLLPLESADSYVNGRTKVEDFMFVDIDVINSLINPYTYYILGPKGCGKTLYAAYMCAEVRTNTKSKCYKIDVSDYGKLIEMKKAHMLDFTAYLTMWKFILLEKFLLAIDPDGISFFNRNKQYKEIQSSVSHFFDFDVTADIFNPVTLIDSFDKQEELSHYLSSNASASGETTVLSQRTGASVGMEMGGTTKEAIKTASQMNKVSSVYTDTWTRAIYAFKELVSSISFKRNHFLFVDGLDVRPNEIDAIEYGECIGSLVRAVYDINTTIFTKTDVRNDCLFKIIALTRTDIFLKSQLVNVTSCICDNSVELDWAYPSESEFEYSNLYRMINRILGGKKGSVPSPIDQYFNFIVNDYEKAVKASLYMQRFTRLRPRDFVRMLRIIQQECKNRNICNPNEDVMKSNYVKNQFSNYYIEQVKSEMLFQYNQEEQNLIISFIRSLRRSVFTEMSFNTMHSHFMQTNAIFKEILNDRRKVLDVLYTLDIIGWKEVYKGKTKIHWHYREIKAIDEVGRMPWEQIDNANELAFILHPGIRRYVVIS